MTAVNYTALSNTLWRINQTMELPAKVDGKTMVFLIVEENNTIVIKGYIPKADGDTFIVPEDELKLGHCWIGRTSLIFNDVGTDESNPKEFVRLYNRLRDMKYDQFTVDIDKHDFHLVISGSLYQYLVTKPVSL